MSSPIDHDALAAELQDAWTHAEAVEPISERHPAADVDDAYAIQHRFLSLLDPVGEETVGYKVGLTSTAMQLLLGVNQPDYSGLLGSMRVADGSTIDRATLIQPKAEAEIAVVLAAPLAGPGVTAAAVSKAAAGVAAAIEVIDSRIIGWRIGLIDTIADLASTARFIVSDRVIPIDGFEPRLVGVVAERNGQDMGTGAGAAALGDPLESAAWTINTLAGYGVTLRAGDVILTGAVHAAFDVTAGDLVTASFDRLGTVGVRFA
jgi:2-keto-4-pentenoate hydratase